MDTNTLDYLLWGLLPVILALVYIVLKNRKFKKQ